MKSILIKDTTRAEREQVIRQSLDCGGGCENCSSCWLGGGNPLEIYRPYIEGKQEIAEINAAYRARYLRILQQQVKRRLPWESALLQEQVILPMLNVFRVKCFSSFIIIRT